MLIVEIVENNFYIIKKNLIVGYPVILFYFKNQRMRNVSAIVRQVLRQSCISDIVSHPPQVAAISLSISGEAMKPSAISKLKGEDAALW